MKYLYLPLCIGFAVSVNAMELSEINTAPTPVTPSTTCPFALLPPEVRDLIAYFVLYHESEKEFVARTKSPKKVPLPLYEHLEAPFKFGVSRPPCNTCVSFCPDETKIILLERYFDHATYVIADIKSQQTLHSIQKLDKSTSPYIALSRCGNIVAYSRMVIDRPRYTNDTRDTRIVTYKDLLIIKNLYTQAVQEMTLPDYLEINVPNSSALCASIAFNKQGTHIIVHGIDVRKLEPFDAQPLNYFIFPLKSELKEHSATVSETTLEEYFKRRAVCKQIAQ